jgi:SRSO17 transposase
MKFTVQTFRILVPQSFGLPNKSSLRYHHFACVRQKFRGLCEKHGLGYVVAISSQAQLFWNGQRSKVREHVAQFKKSQWRRLSCGPGAKGERLYDWAYVTWPHPERENFTRGFLVRRSVSDPNDLAYYFFYCKLQ